jgi:hypothetical protein
MSSQLPKEFSDAPSSDVRTAPEVRPGGHHESIDAARETSQPKSADDAAQGTTVVVRGETVRDQEPRSTATVVVRGGAVRDQEPKARTETPPKGNEAQGNQKSPPKPVSDAKVKMRDRLPALDDDAQVGVQKEQLVPRDGKADLAFTGTLLASAAPSSAPQGQWQEYRVYETNGGKHVFSKVTRSITAGKDDTHEADVFDPAPSSVPSKLLRSARELTQSRPMTWNDAAVAFLGYDPLSKELYRKLSGQFEEHIA